MRARFWVNEVTKKAVSGGEVIAVVKLSPVTRNVSLNGGDYISDNIDWSRYTPSGSMEFTVTQPEAVAYWEARLGSDQLIEFTDPPTTA